MDPGGLSLTEQRRKASLAMPSIAAVGCRRRTGVSRPQLTALSGLGRTCGAAISTSSKTISKARCCGERGLTIPAIIGRALLDHARAEVPNEACGVLSGDRAAGRATTFHPARNEAASAPRYTVQAGDGRHREWRDDLATPRLPAAAVNYRLRGTRMPWTGGGSGVADDEHAVDTGAMRDVRRARRLRGHTPVRFAHRRAGDVDPNGDRPGDVRRAARARCAGSDARDRAADRDDRVAARRLAPEVARLARGAAILSSAIGFYLSFDVGC